MSNRKYVDFEDGFDAVFLPGKIHGSEHQLYIIYFNPDACDGNGCFEIEIIDAERVLELYDTVAGDAAEFFGTLPDLYHGEWQYCNYDDEYFQEYVNVYNDADFIDSRDGNAYDEMMFVVNWAKRWKENNERKVVMNELRVKVDGGVLIATASYDSNYPGIDIEFVPDNQENEDPLTRPRVLVERPKDGDLVAYIWANRTSEDFSDKIIFKEGE